ncbi:MAG: hypothetical protein WCS88_02175 [Patescibacteria group bacterium]|jgi:hypothetical protein
MFYRKVYPKAWQLVKKNPAIWFFGLFASLLGFYEIKILFNFSDKFPDFISANIISWIDIFVAFSTINFGWSNLPDVLALFGLFILFSALTILTVSSQAALTRAAYFKDKKTINESLGLQLNKGIDKFWPVFGLNIINSLIGYFFVTLVLVPIIYFLSSTSDWPIYIILGLFTFFVLMPLVVVISFVTRYGIAYIVIKNQKFTEAFVNSWLLFKLNWIITIENAVTLLAMTFIALVLMVSSMIFIFVPFIIIAKIIPVLSFMFMLIGFFLIAVILIFGTSIYASFYNVVWGTVFLELIAPGKSHSKIHRIVHKHLPGLLK